MPFYTQIDNQAKLVLIARLMLRIDMIWSIVTIYAIYCLPYINSFKTFHTSKYKINKNEMRSIIYKMSAYDTIIDVKSSFESTCSNLRDSDVSLNDYMQLPVEQYVCIKMPLDATLERMHDTTFNLTVPPVKFFNLEVSPMLICDVSQDKNSVIIRSIKYSIQLNYISTFHHFN